MLLAAQVFERVNSAEQAGTLEDWSHEGMPERLLEEEPARGSIVRERHLDALGATQLHLSNGMRVTYRHSDLMQDQVLLSVRSHTPPARPSHVLILELHVRPRIRIDAIPDRAAAAACRALRRAGCRRCRKRRSTRRALRCSSRRSSASLASGRTC